MQMESPVAPLKESSKAALLVIDMQNAVVAAACERDAVASNIGRLVLKARKDAVPVIWVRHADEDLVPGSHDWHIVDDLIPLDGEILVEKHYG